METHSCSKNEVGYRCGHDLMLDTHITKNWAVFAEVFQFFFGPGGKNGTKARLWRVCGRLDLSRSSAGE